MGGVGFDVWVGYQLWFCCLLLCRALSASHIVPSNNTTYKVRSRGPVAHTTHRVHNHTSSAMDKTQCVTLFSIHWSDVTIWRAFLAGYVALLPCIPLILMQGSDIKAAFKAYFGAEPKLQCVPHAHVSVLYGHVHRVDQLLHS